jgi:hypothetical protein
MRSSTERLQLQPISLGPAATCELRADRAVVTPAGVVFAEKANVYAESVGLWVIGGRTARLTIQPRGQRALVVRNGPMANVVRITNGPSQDEGRLAPGELITIRLYTRAGENTVPVRISCETGFRPADWEGGNRDLRFLGVWVALK